VKSYALVTAMAGASGSPLTALAKPIPALPKEETYLARALLDQRWRPAKRRRHRADGGRSDPIWTLT
jgi:hypothetical protein